MFGMRISSHKSLSRKLLPSFLIRCLVLPTVGSRRQLLHRPIRVADPSCRECVCSEILRSFFEIVPRLQLHSRKLSMKGRSFASSTPHILQSVVYSVDKGVILGCGNHVLLGLL